MNIALMVALDISAGGGFQYELSMAALFTRHFSADSLHQVALFSTSPQLAAQYGAHGLALTHLAEADFETVLADQFQVELIYFLNPSPLCLQLKRLPYILTVWDLCHRDHPEFPEVRLNAEFEQRERFYSGPALSKAVAVMVDSVAGRESLLRRYDLDPQRVQVLKYLPRLSSFDDYQIDIAQKYQLKHPYVFYPAQFWAHKNHVYIIDALSLLKSQYGIRLDAIFCGKDYGNLAHVQHQAQLAGIAEQIHYIGFAEDREIPSLYRQSLALVMPTYFGPTNIPPLEAFHYGVPVCYSDLPGLREQVEDAAFLLDLHRPAVLTDVLRQLLSEPVLRQQKIVAGRQKLAQWTADDCLQILHAVLDDFARKRRCWCQALPAPVAAAVPVVGFEQKFYAVARLLRALPADSRLVVYGAGTVGDIVSVLAAAQISAIVDIQSDNTCYQPQQAHLTVYAPEVLLQLDFDYVLITVLGRETAIEQYLTTRLGVTPAKLLRLDLAGTT